MKCAHPDCSRGIGLVSYRRPFGKGRYCSKHCRDNYLAEQVTPTTGRYRAATYFEWLFLQPPNAEPLPQLARSANRIRGR